MRTLSTTARARAALIAGCLLLLTAAPAASQAVVVDPLTEIYREVVAGDVIVIGNGNLRCPTDADGYQWRMYAGLQTSEAACAESQQGTGSASLITNNNNYYMMQGDVDSSASTFNSSSASLTIPAGSSIAAAWLQWGGHTGEFTNGAGTGVIAYPACNTVGVQYSQWRSVLPSTTATGPETQPVGLSVDGATPTERLPSTITKDTGAAWPANSDRLYTAEADVTDLLDGLAPDVAHEITVSNVWAPQGMGCAAGWSLLVVYELPDAEVDFDNPRTSNEIIVFNGHVRQGAAESPTVTSITGLNPASLNLKAGFIAYEGDWGQTGDQFTVDGVAQPEPLGIGTVNDFFIGAAMSASNPEVPVNFSVDNGQIHFTLPSADSDSVDLGFTTSGDGFVMQSMYLVVPVPDLLIRKSASVTQGHPEETVTWTIEVLNPSDAPLNDVVVTDPLYPQCDRTFERLTRADGIQTITCTGELPREDVTNIATVSATSETGAELTRSAEVFVEVLDPAITIEKSADRTMYLAGDTITFTLVVTNAGNTDLSDVEVTDPTVPDCDRAIGDLPIGGSHTYTCTTTAPVLNDQNTATAVGTDPLDLVVSDSSTASAPIARPAIMVTKTADQSVVYEHGEATFTVTVTNTGNVPLIDVELTDELVPGCSASIPVLALGETFVTDCVLTLATSNVTNEVTAVGTGDYCTIADPDCENPQVSGSDSATVEVIPIPVSPSPTPPGSGDLAYTGAGDSVLYLGAALALIAAGTITVLVLRSARHR